MSRQRVIGVFDSGVGGLTVLRALEHALPEQNYLYLGDTARVPYGSRSAEVVTRYAIHNAEALMERAELEMLVVACNTASAVALGALRAALSIPVIGVIQPGAQAAVAASSGGGVLVLATSGTVRSGAYRNELLARTYPGPITQRACPLLVPLVEEGWLTGEVPRLVLEKYLHDVDAKFDTVLLGCTHYPLLRPVVRDVLGDGVSIVDGGNATAEVVRATLNKLKRDTLTSSSTSQGSRAFLVTDAPETMRQLAERFLGRTIDASDVELIDVSVKNTTQIPHARKDS